MTKENESAEKMDHVERKGSSVEKKNIKISRYYLKDWSKHVGRREGRERAR